MTEPRKSRVFNGTWLGRPGETYSLMHDAEAIGRRVVVHTWLDGSGEVEVSAVRGDGRRIGFHRFHHIKLANPSAHELAQAIASATGFLPAKGARL